MRNIMRNAKGIDWLILLWGSLNCAQAPLVNLNNKFVSIFLIPNIILLILTSIMLIFKIKEKQKKLIVLYVFILLFTIFLLIAEDYLSTVDYEL